MNKYLPVIASFLVVGLGQIIKGDGQRGIKLLLTFYFGIPFGLYAILILMGGTIFLIALGFALFAMLLIWAYNIKNAMRRE